MIKGLSKVLAAGILFAASPVQSEPESPGTARFDRTSLVIDDMETSFAFWRDVMKYSVRGEPRQIPVSENKYLGWTKDAVVRFARLQSPEGAGIGLLEVKQDGFPKLDTKRYPAGHGGVILVHVETDIDALNHRAVAAGAVFKPLGLSPSGRSKQMYIKSPGGYVIEVYQLLPRKGK